MNIDKLFTFVLVDGFMFSGNLIQQCMISVEFVVYCDYLFYNASENSELCLHQVSVIISWLERY